MNKYHRIIKMKPDNVEWRTYIDLGIENYVKDQKFKIGDHVSISK